MISKNLIKHIRSLHHGKYRALHGEFIAEGVKVTGELLNSKFRLRYLCALADWFKSNNTAGIPATAEIFEISPEELERISALTTPNQVLAVFEIPEENQHPEIASGELVLALDDLRDPGNLGTIIRTADWFRIHKIICSPGSVDVFNPKTVQSTMGSLARVEVFYIDLAALVNRIRGKIPVTATALQGENLYTATLPEGGLLLIGSESHGLSEELMNMAERRLNIPAFCNSPETTHTAESLNASIATAILCSEFRRRKMI